MRYEICILAGMIGFYACASEETVGQICTRDRVPAVAVRMVDSLTSAAIHAEGISVSVSDGGFTDAVILRLADSKLDRAVFLAYDRAGTYEVKVRAPGYADWSSPGVRVSATPDGCSVEGLNLTARLKPVTASPSAVGMSR